jgi:acyl-CoA hydrolase
MEAKTPSASVVETTHMIQPPDTNSHGTAFGGRIMEWMDIAAAISAMRHSQSAVVTLAVDDLHFAQPIRLGNVVRILASVNYVGTTSMEVGVRVERENIKSKDYEHCLTGYFTFVALDEQDNPTKVPGLEPQTPTEQRRFHNAEIRRGLRLARARDRARHTDSTS